jgi:hypothetical protein
VPVNEAHYRLLPFMLNAAFDTMGSRTKPLARHWRLWRSFYFLI